MSSYVGVQSALVVVARPHERAAFIRRTYGHLAAAIAVFVGLEYFLVQSVLATDMLRFTMQNRYGWLMILGAFVVTGWLARGLATHVASVPVQYAGLAVYVFAEAVIFAPLLHIAVYFSSPGVLPMASILTGTLFIGLTATAMTTQRDFSYLGGVLTVGGIVALGLIVCSVVFGFGLGLIFSAGMVVLAGAAILYDTSKVIHHYTTDQHVAASLELFASVALLFWYVLRIVMRLRN